MAVPDVGEEAPPHRFDEALRDREPDAEVAQTYDADQTFRYAEASGDPMQIHIDETFAKSVGLPGIIIHGLCTMAFTSVAAIEHACPDDPTRLKRLAVRFAAIALPEQTITTRIWDTGAAPRLRDDVRRRRRGDQGRVGRGRLSAQPQSAARARRSQSERRAETRGRLLDATIESLIEVGYAGTTIRHVTELAGVSQGAQSHHFPHRVDLVASAFEQLAEHRESRYYETAPRAPRRPDRADPRPARPALGGLLEPAVHGRAEALDRGRRGRELRKRLVPVERRIYRGLSQLAAEVAGSLADEPDFERRLAVATNTVAGLALVREFDPSGRASKGNQWPYHRDALERVMLGR